MTARRRILACLSNSSPDHSPWSFSSFSVIDPPASATEQRRTAPTNGPSRGRVSSRDDVLSSFPPLPDRWASQAGTLRSTSVSGLGRITLLGLLVIGPRLLWTVESHHLFTRLCSTYLQSFTLCSEHLVLRDRPSLAPLPRTLISSDAHSAKALCRVASRRYLRYECTATPRALLCRRSNEPVSDTGCLRRSHASVGAGVARGGWRPAVVESYALCLMKRQAGLLLAVPALFFNEELLAPAQMSPPTEVLGLQASSTVLAPSCRSS